MKVRAHIIIKVKTRDEDFRIFVSEVALSKELAGWVKNLPDSQVEAVLEGEKKSIDAAIKKYSEGTTSTRVYNIDVNWEESPEDLTAFRIRY